MPFTPSQVSASLQIPSSTLRRWAAKFAPYLSEQPGKKRQYTLADLDVFRRIQDLSAQGLSLDQIASGLQVVEKEQGKGAELLVLDDFVSAMQGLIDSNTRQQEQITKQQEQLVKQQEQLEKQQEQIDFLALPWWQKIGRKPPVIEE